MYKKKLFLSAIIIFSFTALFLLINKKQSTISPKIESKIEEIKNFTEDVKETIIPQPTHILKNGLPDKHLINTTFIPQAPERNWDQPWQDACEEAALLTVNYFYKNQDPDLVTIKDDILKMIDFENSQNFTHDMNIEQMVLVAQNYLNLKTKIINQPSIQDFKEYLSQDTPIIVPASGKILYQENKHFSNGGPYYHNLVVLGYDDNKQQFIVHDVGTKSGAYFKYSYSLLIESIHDFPENKNKEDIQNGSKRILLLLK